MKLTITLRQSGKKPKSVETVLDAEHTNIALMKRLWEAEQLLNTLPGADLRVHISVEENGKDAKSAAVLG